MASNSNPAETEHVSDTSSLPPVPVATALRQNSKMPPVAPSRQESSATVTGNISSNANNSSIYSRTSSFAAWTGLTIFHALEYVGETVVSVLGLDDSRYQDMLDTMTEEEMQRAEQVHAEREAEFQRVRSIRELNQQNQIDLVVMEEGATA